MEIDLNVQLAISYATKTV